MAWRQARACTIKLLFTDEPTGSLDNELATYADRVITLRDGTLVGDERKAA